MERDLSQGGDRSCDICNFNSHAHVERDFFGTIHPGYERISTHTLTWSVTQDLAGSRSAICISTHTLTWSVTQSAINPPTLETNFNSHAHVERDTLHETGSVRTNISTHTLTWSVTEWVLSVPYSFKISTHTLTWSVTLFHVLPFSFHLHFNSHAHVERDAPSLSQRRCARDFNSHAHVERDPCPVDLTVPAH